MANYNNLRLHSRLLDELVDEVDGLKKWKAMELEGKQNKMIKPDDQASIFSINNFFDFWN